MFGAGYFVGNRGQPMNVLVRVIASVKSRATASTAGRLFLLPTRRSVWSTGITKDFSFFAAVGESTFAASTDAIATGAEIAVPSARYFSFMTFSKRARHGGALLVFDKVAKTATRVFTDEANH